MNLQTWDVAPQAEKVLDIIALLCSSSFVEGGILEVDVPTSGRPLAAVSTITTTLHSPLRIQSESRSVSGSGSTTEKVNTEQPEDHAEQHHLPAPIPAAQIENTSGHNTLGKKRKLDRGELSDIDAVGGDEDHPIVIPDAEDERPPKKQRKPVTVTNIWVRNSRGKFELYSECDFEALKDEVSDYTFLRDVAEMSGHNLSSFDTIECHLADTVPRRQLTFRYDGRRSAKRWIPTIDSYFQQTLHTYTKLNMELQQFEVWVMPVPKRVSLDVPLILESSMCNVNPSEDSF